MQGGATNDSKHYSIESNLSAVLPQVLNKGIHHAWNNRPMSMDRLDMIRKFHSSELIATLLQMATLLN